MITILKNSPCENGAYQNQTFCTDNVEIPFDCVVIPDEFLPIWEQYKPFVTISIENGIIVSMVENQESRTIQELSDANITKEITASQRISMLETLVLQLGGII